MSNNTAGLGRSAMALKIMSRGTSRIAEFVHAGGGDLHASHVRVYGTAGTGAQ